MLPNRNYWKLEDFNQMVYSSIKISNVIFGNVFYLGHLLWLCWAVSNTIFVILWRKLHVRPLNFREFMSWNSQNFILDYKLRRQKPSFSICSFFLDSRVEFLCRKPSTNYVSDGTTANLESFLHLRGVACTYEGWVIISVYFRVF